MDGYDCQSERGHGFHEILQHRAATTATCAAFHFLGSKEETLTYGELHSRAACVAGQLLQKGMAGARVLLLFPPGLDYISALFGCLYAGCVAVPAYPPRNLRQMPRIRSIVADAQATCVLTTSFLLHKLEGEVTGDFKWICIDAVHREVFDELNRRAPRQQIAILQYTSGSTGVPKGVMLTHENLLHNSEHIRRRFQCTEDSVCVIWLPPYHDMGLIGGIMQPLYSGFPCVLLSPAAFAQQPAAWLSAISRFGGTISGGPNFAYDLCVERIAEEQLAELDLSTWTVAFNGAEAVRAETMRRFADRFAPYGFRSNAFLPCYGLAEATLLVTAGRWSGASGSGGNVASEKDPVSCGVGLDDQRVAIVDPDRRIECLPAMEGEIWISGASVARGYWGQPRLTDGTFYNVKLEGDAARSNATAYLRTGDLGYVRDGELFVTGRMKDVINLGGRKFHPQDIEATAQASHGALRGAAAVAFSIEADNTEQLIVAQELAPRFRGDAECIIDSIRQSILLIYSREAWTSTTGEIPPDGPVQRSTVTYVLSTFGEEQADRVWFSKNLVMGFGSFRQPLKKLKDAGDIAARVLLAMYRDADMTSYGGVPPSAGLWRRYETKLSQDYGHARLIHGQEAGTVSSTVQSQHRGDKDIAEFWQSVRALESLGLLYEVVMVVNRDPVRRKFSNDGDEYGDVPEDAEPLYELDARSLHGYKPSGEEGLGGITARTVGELGYPVASDGKFYGKYAAIVNRGQGAMIVGIYRPRFRVSNPKNAGVRDTWARIRASQREALEFINRLRESRGLEALAMPGQAGVDRTADDTLDCAVASG